MTNKKLFYKVGDLLETRGMFCQTEQDYQNKICLVLRSFYKNNKAMYEVKIIDYVPKLDMFGDSYYPFCLINGDPSHIIIEQHKLRRRN